MYYDLAGLIGVYIQKVFDTKNEIDLPRPWDTYPELFDKEKREYETISTASHLEEAKLKRLAYAKKYNELRKGGMN